MYMQDIAEYAVIIHSTFVEQTNMVLQRKQKLIKRVFHVRKSVINTMLFMKKFINGSIYRQIILDEHQQRNRKKSSTKFSRNSSTSLSPVQGWPKTLFLVWSSDRSESFVRNFGLWIVWATSCRSGKELTKDLDANNMLCEKEVQQLWSPGLEKFLADRFVEGTCPLVSDLSHPQH